MSEKKVTLGQKILMDGGRIVLFPLTAYYRVKKYYVSGKEEGRQQIKELKGAMIAANHQSFADPFVLNAAFWYRRFFYTASELIMSGVKGVLLKGAGCIKIDRTKTDLKCIKRCSDVMKENYLLGIFPQGTIAGGAAHSGIFIIAAMADVPIVPVYIKKRKHIWNRYKVVFGRQFKVSDYVKNKIPNQKDLDLLLNVFDERAHECQNYLNEI